MKIQSKIVRNCRQCIHHVVCDFVTKARQIDGAYSVETCTDKNPNLLYDTLMATMASECTKYLLSGQWLLEKNKRSELEIKLIQLRRKERNMLRKRKLKRGEK